MKRMIATLLVCCMLVVMLPGIAVKSAAATPSVEDILNDYHAKAFESRAAGEAGGASTYARGGSGKTLEQETVDTLTAAGYEAYNVTPENYDELEQKLNTDFEDKQIYPTGSYIVIVGGENLNSTRSANGSLPEEDLQDPPGSGGGSTGSEPFYYYNEYYDHTWKMRYFIAVYVADAVTVDLLSRYGSTFVSELANTNASAYIKPNTYYSQKSEIGILSDIWGFNNSITYVPSALSVKCEITWTRKYIDVFDESSNSWSRTTYSEYATTKTTFEGKYYNQRYFRYETVNSSSNATFYSFDYFNTEDMKLYAAVYFMGLNTYVDRTHEIQVHIVDEDNNDTVVLTVFDPA